MYQQHMITSSPVHELLLVDKDQYPEKNSITKMTYRDLTFARPHQSHPHPHCHSTLIAKSLVCWLFLCIHFVVVIMHTRVQTALGIVSSTVLFLSSFLSSVRSSFLLLVSLADIVALLEALTLTTAGVGVFESEALLVLALGEVSGLIGTVDTISLEWKSWLA